MARRRDRWSYPSYPAARPRPVKDGLKAKSRRGRIGETWWSDRWIEVLESFNMGARLGRGRSYARRGQVASIDIEPGAIQALVQGSRARPYAVQIGLKPLSDRDWSKAIAAMAAQAIFAAKLLAGEMPQDIEDAFRQAKVELFPTRGRDLVTECSCPDWANPCKHVAAVYYLLAEEFDRDPFMIFKLRGRSKEEIVEVLRAKRAEAAAEKAPEPSPGAREQREEAIPPLDADVDRFWSAGPELEEVRPMPAAPAVDGAILRRLGEANLKVRGRDLADLLAPAYTALTRYALDKAGMPERPASGAPGSRSGADRVYREFVPPQVAK